eukprot:8632112-Pyramimonas_sp.AAC.1
MLYASRHVRALFRPHSGDAVPGARVACEFLPRSGDAVLGAHNLQHARCRPCPMGTGLAALSQCARSVDFPFGVEHCPSGRGGGCRPVPAS